MDFQGAHATSQHTKFCMGYDNPMSSPFFFEEFFSVDTGLSHPTSTFGSTIKI
jgi:hypothetical protein